MTHQTTINTSGRERDGRISCTHCFWFCQNRWKCCFIMLLLWLVRCSITCFCSLFFLYCIHILSLKAIQFLVQKMPTTINVKILQLLKSPIQILLDKSRQMLSNELKITQFCFSKKDMILFQFQFQFSTLSLSPPIVLSL